MDRDAFVIELPHFGAPFAFGMKGTVDVVEQDTVEHVAACVFNIASCTVGQVPMLPDLGISDLTASTVPVDTDGLVAEIAGQEPRAQLMATESGSQLDVTLRTIQLNVSTQGR